MPYRNVSLWLEDIIISIEELKLFTKDVGGFSGYINNKMLTLACERCLEIIAEALKQAMKLEPALPISNVSAIIGLRNIINHVYYEIEHDRIWAVITRHVPVLESEVRKILEDYERRLELNEL